MKFQQFCSVVPASIIYYTFLIVLSLVLKSLPPLNHQSLVTDYRYGMAIQVRPWLVDVVEGKGKR